MKPLFAGNLTRRSLLAAGGLLPAAANLSGQAQAVNRPLAPWPPPSGRLRVVIDADVANEVDDQWALALAFAHPERLKLEGMVMAHFGDAGGARGIQKSLEETNRMLDLAGLSGKFPVKPGADPIQYRDRPPSAGGIDFIIERARTATPDDPLWLILLGPATDAAAALLKAPDIADRMVVFWHGRTQWPLRCWNFNAYNDIRAARLLFELPCRFILFDTGTYLRMTMEESERRIRPVGKMGAYLHQIRSRKPQFMLPTKGFFDLGDIVALIDPEAVRWEKTQAPAVEQDLQYNFSRRMGDIVRIYHVETGRSFDLLETALRRLAT